MKLPKESDHNLGAVANGAKLKSPRSNFAKLFLLFVVGALIIGGSYWLWFESRNNEESGSGLTQDQIKTIGEQQAEAAASYEPPVVSLAKLDEINLLILKEKYPEAKVMAENLLTTKNLTTTDKELLYGYLNVTCSQLKDLICMEKVLSYIESTKTEEPNIGQYVVTARIAKETGSIDKAKLYYGKALAAIDKLGGQSYLDETYNQGAEQGLEYQELVDGAR